MLSRTHPLTSELARAMTLALALAALVSSLAPRANAQSEKLLSKVGFTYAGVIFDSAGNLYGAAMYGGGRNPDCNVGCGSIFMLSPTSSGWTETALYNFTGGNDGSYPAASPIFDAAGNLYGTTFGGGQFSRGVVYKLSPVFGGDWTETVLYSFTGKEDGGSPVASLALDAAGNLYGTAPQGGIVDAGVIFQLSPTSGGGWTENILHSFTGLTDGGSPTASLILDAAGNLCGTTAHGGNLGTNVCYSAGCGVVFELSYTSTGWQETVLHAFGGKDDGVGPVGSLTFDAAGNLYGATLEGGHRHEGHCLSASPRLKRGLG